MNLESLIVQSDRRGDFIEAFKLPTDGQVSYILIAPNEVRGNHYHKYKTECFVVVGGSATITVKDRDRGNIMSVRLSHQDPMAVTVVPNHTHNIIADNAGSLVLVWCDKQYDSDDPDTFMEEV